MLILGIDEVGRGCWAGPLVAAAVVLNPSAPIEGLNDSKKLSLRKRQLLDEQIQARALAVGIGWVWPEAIDSSGITEAVKMAMTTACQQALTQLQTVAPQHSGRVSIIIDGNYNYLPEYGANVQTLVGADGSVPAASAASIVAKVARDNYMTSVADRDYPDYGFARHVGYGTALHIERLQRHGVSPLHRRSFKPIAAILGNISDNDV